MLYVYLEHLVLVWEPYLLAHFLPENLMVKFLVCLN